MYNPMDMTGRIVLVTGGSSGIGKAIAELVAQLGGRVVLVSRDASKLKPVLSSLAGEGHGYVALDLAKTEQIPPMMQDIAKKFGRLHGFVHCAGIMLMRPIQMLDPIECENTLSINITAAAALTKGLMQSGVRDETGSVIFISSVIGIVGQPTQWLYGATKGALIAMARSLAVELAPRKLRVNCVAPAIVDVGISGEIKAKVSPDRWNQIVAAHPLGIGKPQDVANATAFLLSDASRWITGTTLVVDGGYTAQ